MTECICLDQHRADVEVVADDLVDALQELAVESRWC